MMVYNTGLIPSRFYEVLLTRDKEDFSSLLISSLLIIIGVSLVSFQLREKKTSFMVLTVGSLLSTATTKGLQTPFVHNYKEQIFGKCFFNYLKS